MKRGMASPSYRGKPTRDSQISKAKLRLRADPRFYGRWVDLEREAAKHKVDVRLDSKLAYAFANDYTDSWTSEIVARWIAEGHWLQHYTNYRTEVAKGIKEQVRKLTPVYGRVEAWRCARETARPEVRERVLSEHGGFPETWPWMGETHKG